MNLFKEETHILEPSSLSKGFPQPIHHFTRWADLTKITAYVVAVLSTVWSKHAQDPQRNKQISNDSLAHLLQQPNPLSHLCHRPAYHADRIAVIVINSRLKKRRCC